MAGYSLGGLVARYALGILYTRPDFFQRHMPLNFATMASPWLGSLRYATLFNRLFTIVGSRFISRSGEQLFCVDKEQLIARLARKGAWSLMLRGDPSLTRFYPSIVDDVFYKALEQFRRIDVFASAQNDRTVPFPSGAFVETDPFEDWDTSGLIVCVRRLITCAGNINVRLTLDCLTKGATRQLTDPQVMASAQS